MIVGVQIISHVVGPSTDTQKKPSVKMCMKHKGSLQTPPFSPLTCHSLQPADPAVLSVQLLVGLPWKQAPEIA